MRLTGAFLAICAALIAACVWELWPGRPSATAVRSPSAQAPSRPADRQAPAAEADATHTDPDAALPMLQPSEPPSGPGGRTASPDVDSMPEPVESCDRCSKQTAPDSSTSRAAAPVHWVNRNAPSAAERTLDRALIALQEDPYGEAALHDAVAAAIALGRLELAWQMLDRLHELRPQDVALRFEQADLLIRMQRWTAAAAALHEVVVASPDDARAWTNLAAVERQAGRLETARQAWDCVVELRPDDVEALAQRGSTCLDLHDWAAAQVDFEQVLRITPGALDAELNLALALARLGEWASAVQQMQSCALRHPDERVVLNRLASIGLAAWRATADQNPSWRAAALEAAQRSLALDPQQPDIQAIAEQCVELRP